MNDHEFAAYWNDIERYPTVRDIAQATGIKYVTCKTRASKIRRKYQDGVNGVPLLIDRQNPPTSILPEEKHEYRADMTREMLLETLRTLYLSNPDKNITRISFRRDTNISDSTWTQHFGTFLEFKRQAGIEMSRPQHALERQIAKHVAHDHYRDFNDRHDYSDRYIRPVNRNTKVIVGCSDLHDIECDPFYLRVFIESCRLIQPDIINFGGDIFDLPEFGKFGVDPREWDVVGRIKFVHEKIFKPLREACPNAQFDFVEGNHEFRLLRHMADATPALRAVLSDLHGFTVAKLLGLDEFEINYIAKGDLAAFHQKEQKREVEKSYVIYDDALLIHHHPHARSWGLPGWNGHHHHHKVFHERNALQGGYQWHQLGCGHELRASYAEGEFWTLGFMVSHINTQTKSVNFEYINVTDFACVGGIYFHRQADECKGFYAGRAA